MERIPHQLHLNHFILFNIIAFTWMESEVKNICKTKYLWVGPADTSTLHYFPELLEKNK